MTPPPASVAVRPTAVQPLTRAGTLRSADSLRRPRFRGFRGDAHVLHATPSGSVLSHPRCSQRLVARLAPVDAPRHT